MSDDQSPVFMADDSDPEMQRAYEQARASFRYFWREVAMDQRRIVPALDLAYVKAPFSDGPDAGTGEPGEPEYMWLDEIGFDGEFVTGVLLNEPNWVTSIQEGDTARVPLARISDWMYSIDGNVYGAYTVNLLRARMSAPERQEHDDAWGLNFGDPLRVRTGHGGESHAADETMAASLREHLAKNPSLASVTGDHGWTLLHQEASAGNAATVKVLLDAGADANAVAENGMTSLHLANALGWESVVDLLSRR
ncbi:DUF2314 domain-containing protein [Longimicrobium terrae]|uniref:Uncharacterized protein YegJ (DUF2314 family) n=1 Tax=Longimicrobium terrae TaxID=1639882 RepID=A0A841H686_9BACT|nr:DUF2314 domain-containing protein [Longimicrobium terrae]MBB4639248.1 uncharacterized protein YegJ (DUF2314 family) [Longimicrobium terrae]MBB6073488.1 uncharacterized protein YegJ (DUF2314 family) [Longimicrobium terrae]NNC32262.1 DUF2314 domain-containing protein [Longimicrobium terrae]